MSWEFLNLKFLGPSVRKLSKNKLKFKNNRNKLIINILMNKSKCMQILNSMRNIIFKLMLLPTSLKVRKKIINHKYFLMKLLMFLEIANGNLN